MVTTTRSSHNGIALFAGLGLAVIAAASGAALVRQHVYLRADATLRAAALAALRDGKPLPHDARFTFAEDIAAEPASMREAAAAGLVTRAELTAALRAGPYTLTAPAATTVVREALTQTHRSLWERNVSGSLVTTARGQRYVVSATVPAHPQDLWVQRVD